MKTRPRAHLVVRTAACSPTCKRKNRRKNWNATSRAVTGRTRAKYSAKRLLHMHSIIMHSTCKHNTAQTNKGMCSLFVILNNGIYIPFVWLFPGVLEGLGSSGRLVGIISTYPGTYKCPGSRVMTKNHPGGIFFTVHGISRGTGVEFKRETEQKARNVTPVGA